MHDAHEHACELHPLQPDSTQLRHVSKMSETVTSGFTPGETFTHLTRQQDEECLEELVFSPQNDGVTPSMHLIPLSVRLL